MLHSECVADVIVHVKNLMIDLPQYVSFCSDAETTRARDVTDAFK